MCGIVGYVGFRDATAVVLDGLRKLEYRGYDSAGIAVADGSTIEVRRAAGKLDNLETIVEANPTSGKLGIGHTRWATHGEPSNRNSHPHTDCHGQVVVIHNGIVENFLELKRELQGGGHVFSSETDTEVIAHLIEEYLKSGAGFEDAFRQMLGRVKGAHAILAINRDYPDRIVAARLGNAGGIVVGCGQGEMFVASDMPAILGYTREMVFLDNREMAVVTAEGATYSDTSGNALTKTSQHVSWDPVAAAKDGYKHFMLKEIHEQAQSVTDCISGRLGMDPPEIEFEHLNMSAAELRRVTRVVICACGTALHAGLVGKFLLEELAGLPTEVDYASEFRYRDTMLDSSTLMLAITQSGETVDTLVSMEAARSQGVKTVAIVNVVGSQASRIADGVVYTHAGPEIGVASTKAFTSQLVALNMLALHLGRIRGSIYGKAYQDRLDQILQLPAQVSATLSIDNEYEDLAEDYHKALDFLYIGRGINYPIALEGALKLKEISYIHAEGYPAGEMKHGPIALIDDAMPVVALVPQDNVYSKMVSNIEQIKARRGQVIAVANVGDTEIASKADRVLWIPQVSRHMTPILAVIPLQLLAYHLAVRRGCDVDQPRNLAKSVTVE